MTSASSCDRSSPRYCVAGLSISAFGGRLSRVYGERYARAAIRPVLARQPAQTAVGKAEEGLERVGEAQPDERRTRFAPPLLAVSEVVLRGRRFDVILFLDAFGVSVAVGEIDDAHGAAGGFDALHQTARAKHLVVGMRSDDEQTCGVGDVEHCRRRWRRRWFRCARFLPAWRRGVHVGRRQQGCDGQDAGGHRGPNTIHERSA